MIEPLLAPDLSSACTCPPSREQLELFDREDFLFEQAGHPAHPLPRVTGGDRRGFWHGATPDVFLGRHDDGPLVVCPDTDVLIWLVDEIERLEEKIGLLVGPLLSGDWREPVEAISDVLQLWQFRDVRFFVSEHYLRDGRLTPERFSVRQRVVDELAIDFAMRGGFDTNVDGDLEDDLPIQQRGCPVHPAREPMYARTPARWPHAKDRPLVADALRGGCHAFLTCDKRVLACAGAFASCGLAIMTPGELLERLDRDGQLDLAPEWPIDLDSIARFYGIAVAVGEAA